MYGGRRNRKNMYQRKEQVIHYDKILFIKRKKSTATQEIGNRNTKG